MSFVMTPEYVSWRNMRLTEIYERDLNKRRRGEPR
jgi:hypothetical protein